MQTVFPAEELVSYDLLLDYAERDDVDFDAIIDGVEFVGLSYCLDLDDYIYLFYLAVSPDLQSRGYGSRILAELKKRYPGKTITLEAESTSVDADNIEQRMARACFYERNGFMRLPFKISEEGVIYDAFTCGPLPEGFGAEDFINSMAKKFPEIASCMQAC
jgi:ribosomal protein S18 acetylase RimI-like enzyme